MHTLVLVSSTTPFIGYSKPTYVKIRLRIHSGACHSSQNMMDKKLRGNRPVSQSENITLRSGTRVILPRYVSLEMSRNPPPPLRNANTPTSMFAFWSGGAWERG